MWSQMPADRSCVVFSPAVLTRVVGSHRQDGGGEDHQRNTAAALPAGPGRLLSTAAWPGTITDSVVVVRKSS